MYVAIALYSVWLQDLLQALDLLQISAVIAFAAIYIDFASCPLDIYPNLLMHAI